MDGLVADIGAGRSRVLVLRGEPGIGKTALMRYVAGASDGCQVVGLAGVESDMELPYVGLHQLCSPFLSRIEGLPDPQRDALDTALGRRAGHPPDRLRVGLATLTLLADAAQDQPLICLVDDSQWLDRASAEAVAFVARRLVADRVAIIISARDSALTDLLAGLPELALSGLAHREANALLSHTVSGPLDAQVREQLLTETRGNPLALLQLPRGLAAAELAFKSWPSEFMPVPSRIEQSFAQRVAKLPAPSQRLLLTAAADPTGDPLLLRRAANRLGLPLEAGVSAEDAGLVDLRGRVVFQHPLVRSAIYRSAPLDERRSVHRALAAVTDMDRDPDRRAWHRAHGATGPDEDVAADLQRSAGRALERGGLAASAAFMEKSVALTPDLDKRARRALVAAQAKFAAGAFADSLTLLAEAEAGPLDGLERARIDLLRAQITFASERGNRALPLLLAAAKRLEPLDPTLALDTYLDAFSAAMFAGRFATGSGTLAVARAAQELLQRRRLPRKGDRLLTAVATMVTEGHARAASAARDATSAFRAQPVSLEEGLRFMWLAIALTVEMWEYENWVSVNTRHVHIVREAGAYSALPLALNSHVYVTLFTKGVHATSPVLDEARRVTNLAGDSLTPYGELAVAAWQGREQPTLRLLDRSLEETRLRGEGIGVCLVQWSRAVLCNGRGRFPEAMQAAQEASKDPAELGAVNWGLFELVESAERSGQRDVALDAVQRLTKSTIASGTDWGLGTLAYATALTHDGETVEGSYQEAIRRLGRMGPRAYLARAHLVYGEWLLTGGRRKDARQHLRTAHDVLAAMGFEAFAFRAGRGLEDAGEAVRQEAPEKRQGVLTVQETHIAQLAADGLSNPEIAGQLFISPRTVEWHLRNVFQKLGVSTRGELRGSLSRR